MSVSPEAFPIKERISQDTCQEKPHLPINGQLVPVEVHPLRNAHELYPGPVFVDEEKGFAATFPKDYKLPENPIIGEVVIVTFPNLGSEESRGNLNG